MHFDKQINIYSNQGIRLDIGSKYGSVTGPHTHDNEYQIEVLLSGESKSLINKKDMIVMPGYIDIYNPTDLHEVDYRNTESFIFHVKVNALKKIYTEMEMISFYKEPVFKSSFRNKINIPLTLLRQEIIILKNITKLPTLNSIVELYLENKVMMLLNILLGEISTFNIARVKPTKNHLKLENAVHWMHENFSRDDIDLTYLANISHLSKFHFIRIFKDVYGKTPYEFLMQLRVNEAIRLLKRNKYRNMDDVGVSLGFRNAAQLRYHLKKYKFQI